MKKIGFRKTRMSGKVRIFFSCEKTTVVDPHLIALQNPTFQTMYLSYTWSKVNDYDHWSTTVDIFFPGNYESRHSLILVSFLPASPFYISFVDTSANCQSSIFCRQSLCDSWFLKISILHIWGGATCDIMRLITPVLSWAALMALYAVPSTSGTSMPIRPEAREWLF